MATSQAYMQQLESMGTMPDFNKEVRAKYADPVYKPLVEEGAQLQGQYLSNLFEPFIKMGTGASDMSPAAKLGALSGSMGRHGARVGANNALQSFFDMEASNMANSLGSQWQNKYNSIKDLFTMAYQNEEAQRQQAARNAQMAAQRRAEEQSANLLRQLQGGSMGGMNLSALTPQQQQAVTNLRGAGQSLGTALQPLTNTIQSFANSPLGTLAKGLGAGFLNSRQGGGSPITIRVP